MSKSFNTSRKTSGNKGAGIGSQKFVDPLAFASGKAAAPATTWMLDPAMEGVDHINIHSDSQHSLGRWFNPRATHPFPMGTLGSFNTIEAYMYFLLANSMRVTDPEVIARVDSMRQASSVMLGSATAHLPNDMRQAYAHTYRLPADVYKNIIRYVADAYMSKLYEVAKAQNKSDILDTNLAQDILENRLPYFGYYLSNGVTMNVSQRTTIISAIQVLEKRLHEEVAERKRSYDCTMNVAMRKAGVTGEPSDSVRFLATNSFKDYEVAVANGFAGTHQAWLKGLRIDAVTKHYKDAHARTHLGMSLVDVSVAPEALTMFREEAEAVLLGNADLSANGESTEQYQQEETDSMAVDSQDDPSAN